MGNKRSSRVSYIASFIRKFRITGLSLITGAVAFMTFWIFSSATSSDSIPFTVPLAVHGMSIILLSLGLFLLARSIKKPIPSYWVTRVGAAVTITGLLTVFPLIPLGLGIFTVGLVMGAICRKGAIVAMSGSVILFVSVVLGARIGMEDAPVLSDELRIAFQMGVFLIALGLVIIGMRLTRNTSSPV